MGLASVTRYDFTTDIVDQRIGFYTCKTITARWTMVAFAYLLDTCRVNSCSMDDMNKEMDPRRIDSLEYGWTLGMELTLPQIHARSFNGLGRPTEDQIGRWSTTNQGRQLRSARSGCNTALEVAAIVGREGKKKKDALGRARTLCQR
ncbi:hypothetical protein Bbelb_047870 [Branchiostoma belcheri]|nr:hypothetical protein Bbelb_047870 [Branchiostoma belcheri]